MQLSVIILNYNVRYFLELCVLSVQSALTNIDSEIIVVDNNSSDSSCEVMAARFPNIKLIKNTENTGFPKGNNIGVAKASGKYICILNPDTVVAEDSFIKILAFAEKQNNLGVVGCKLIDGRGQFLQESKRGVPTPWVAFTKISGLYKLFPNLGITGKYYAQHLPNNKTGKVDILVGAFMFMKRDLYLSLSGFDENCFMYSDDIDLSYRALQQGKDNYYFPETTVIHYKGESTLKDDVYRKRLQEAMHFFYKKHFNGSPAFTLFMRIGSYFFSFRKKIEGKSLDKLPISYLILSENEELATKLSQVVHKEVQIQQFKTKKEICSYLNAKKEVEIILDNEFLSFKECISIIRSLKTEKYTFKIKPKMANYLIGSNSSNGRGEIVKIK